jgi:hypothetical protein
VSDKVIEAVLTNQTMLLLPKAMYWFYFTKGYLYILMCFAVLFCFYSNKFEILKLNSIFYRFLSSDAEVYGATNVTMLNFSMDKFVGRNKAIFNRF